MAPVKAKRNRAFRKAVLTAYEYSCAACGWSVYLAGTPLGLEAAHLYWHTHGGPDDLSNGLCLCSLHHLALDRGAIGIDAEGNLLVSQHLHGGEGMEAGLRALAGQPLRDPQPGSPQINPAHATWHREQVFLHPSRSV